MQVHNCFAVPLKRRLPPPEARAMPNAYFQPSKDSPTAYPVESSLHSIKDQKYPAQFPPLPELLQGRTADLFHKRRLITLRREEKRTPRSVIPPQGKLKPFHFKKFELIIKVTAPYLNGLSSLQSIIG